MRARLAWTLGRLAPAAALVAVWEVAASHDANVAFLFGSPGGCWAALRQWSADGTLATQLRATFTVLALGWAIGRVAGAAVGIALGASRWWYEVCAPFIAFLNGIPRIVFYPFFAVWLGYTAASKVVLVVFVIIFIVIVNVVAALREIDRAVVAHVRIVGGKDPQLARHVYLPAVTGWILGNSRVTVAFALQACLVSEFFGPSAGIGISRARGPGDYDIDQVWAAIVAIVILALILDQRLRFIGARTEKWRTE